MEIYDYYYIKDGLTESIYHADPSKTEMRNRSPLFTVATVLIFTSSLIAVHAFDEQSDEILLESIDDAVRRQAIDEAVAETQLYIQSMDEASAIAAANLQSKTQMEGAERVLFKLFKIPSKKAIKQGRARIAFEEMIRRADIKLLKLKSASEEDVHDEVGSILTSSELTELFQVSGCAALLTPPPCSSSTINTYRTVDGTCNNLKNPLWGAATTAFRRILDPYYEDGISTIRGYLQNYGDNALPFDSSVPSPRIVSTSIVIDQNLDETSASHMVMQFGQFLDHDITIAPTLPETCAQCKKTDFCLPILVPASDEQFGGQCLSFIRTVPACTNSGLPRQQINDITSFIDGSMIYGSDTTLASQLRDTHGGLLKVGASIPPGAKPSLPLDPSPFACPGCFLAGDIRVNEQIGITTLQTIFMREHNRVATELAKNNKKWNDEKLYQEARKIVGAEIQRIVYYEYLPAVMGTNNFEKFIGQYTGYNELINPSIPTEFSTAAFRFGHSQVRPSYTLLDNNYITTGAITLVNAFNNPSMYTVAQGTDQILRGMLTTNSRRTDEFLVFTLTNELFKSNPSPGTDLASLNIQRGRDHGLPPYSAVQKYCQGKTGITPTFKNGFTFTRANQIYGGSLETADLWPMGLAETPITGSLIGPTFTCLFADTFRALRDGDRFYFEKASVFTASQLTQIRKATLSRIICDNADNINEIEPNAFLISGARTKCSNLAKVDIGAWKECGSKLRNHH